MPLLTIIKLTLQNGVVVPEDHAGDSERALTRGGLSEAERGQTVEFAGDQSFQDWSVHFLGTSPFEGTLVVHRGDPARVISASAPSATFVYDCRVRDEGGVEHESKGGGRMQIVP